MGGHVFSIGSLVGSIVRVPPLGPFGFPAIWRLLTTFATGPWAILTLAVEIAAVVWYVRLARLRGERGHPWPRRRVLFFVLGIFNLAFAWQTGVPIYAAHIFTVHILQHLALMMSAPILFAMSAPVTLAMQTSSRAAKTRILRVLKSRPVRAITNPLPASVGNYGIMYWFFLDHGIVVSMAHPPLMDFVNFLFLFFGCLVWWPIVSVDYIGRRRYAYGIRLGLGLLGMPFDSFLAITLLNGGAKESIAPHLYTLASVQNGAQVFWILVMALSFLGSAVLVAQWIRYEERASRRNDQRLERQGIVVGGSSAAGWGREVHVDENGFIPLPWMQPPAAAPAMPVEPSFEASVRPGQPEGAPAPSER